MNFYYNVDDKKPDVTEVHDYCYTKGELRVLESLSSALKVMEKRGGEYL